MAHAAEEGGALVSDQLATDLRDIATGLDAWRLTAKAAVCRDAAATVAALQAEVARLQTCLQGTITTAESEAADLVEQLDAQGREIAALRAALREREGERDAALKLAAEMAEIPLGPKGTCEFCPNYYCDAHPESHSPTCPARRLAELTKGTPS